MQLYSGVLNYHLIDINMHAIVFTKLFENEMYEEHFLFHLKMALSINRIKLEVTIKRIVCGFKIYYF